MNARNFRHPKTVHFMQLLPDPRSRRTALGGLPASILCFHASLHGSLPHRRDMKNLRSVCPGWYRRFPEQDVPHCVQALTNMSNFPCHVVHLVPGIFCTIPYHFRAFQPDNVGLFPSPGPQTRPKNTPTGTEHRRQQALKARFSVRSYLLSSSNSDQPSSSSKKFQSSSDFPWSK